MLKTLALFVTAVMFGLALRADARTFEVGSASEWAGGYWLAPPNSTMTMRLVITPASRFDLSMGGCFGTDEVSRGRAEFRDGVLLLNPGLPDSKSMIPVRFREKLYLVEADRVGEFVATTGGGNGDCRGNCPGFFIRESDIE